MGATRMIAVVRVGRDRTHETADETAGGTGGEMEEIVIIIGTAAAVRHKTL